MGNRLRLTGILTPPADDAWMPGVGYVKFEPADEAAAHWSVPGYRPAWPVVGVPNVLGNGLVEPGDGALYVPGSEPGDAYDGPWMRVRYSLQTTAGTWHQGSFRWRAVSTGGGVIDLRTPAPELAPPVVRWPGVPASALTTNDLDSLVPSKAAFDAALGSRGIPGGLATLNEFGQVRQPLAPQGYDGDWNTLPASGLFDSARGTNRPFGGAWQYLINVAHRNATGYTWQIAAVLDGGGGANERVLTRRQFGGAWSPWRDLVVLVERVVERGITCLRYSDGQQVVYGNVVLEPYTGGGGFDVVFPRGFVDTGYTLLLTNGDWVSFRGYLAVWTTSHTGAHVVAWQLDNIPRPVGIGVRVMFRAEGRWY